MKSRLLSSIPFLVITIIVTCTWFEILTTEYTATWRHYVGLVLVGINAVIYFMKQREAVLLTGIILFLGTFNLLSFFTIIRASALGIGSVKTPEIQVRSLLLLVIYCVINFNLLLNWYLDMDEKRARKNVKNN